MLLVADSLVACDEITSCSIPEDETYGAVCIRSVLCLSDESVEVHSVYFDVMSAVGVMDAGSRAIK